MLLFAFLVVALFLSFCAGYATRSMLSRRRRASAFGYRPYGVHQGGARTVISGLPAALRGIGR